MRDPGSPPLLAPGLRVVSRGADQLQVGLHDGRRVLLPRSERVEHALALLLERRALDADPTCAEVLERLDRSGCLEVPSARDGAHVAVLGHVEAAALPERAALPEVDGLFAAAGVQTTTSLEQADVVLVLSTGELDRARLDPLLRGGTSHLVVRLVDGGALLGPFVVPGTTACLRCIDAHESLLDPDHVVVTARYARASVRPRADGVPDVDPALATVALGWAVRDVVAHLAGAEPSTWSRTLFLGPDLRQRHEREWLRHPTCGCCWP